jgi:hypothetical protein
VLDRSDPRAALASYGGDTKRPAMQSAPAEYLSLREFEPQETTDLVKTWLVRAQNFVIAYSEVRSGARLVRRNQADEYMALIYDPSCLVEVVSTSGRATVGGNSLAIVPPGDSEIVARGGGRVVRAFSIQAADLVARCSNRGSYELAHANVLAAEPWPPPADGYKLRTYSLDVADDPSRFGRIFRCTNLMVNFVISHDGPRDTTKLSPHSHDDFEQFSLLIEGECIQHVRYPWLPDVATWREDEHVRVAAPSVTIFPPPCIHTSMWIAPGRNQLIDFFSPPRLDWSQQPGWVLNADDYQRLP